MGLWSALCSEIQGAPPQHQEQFHFTTYRWSRKPLKSPLLFLPAVWIHPFCCGAWVQVGEKYPGAQWSKATSVKSPEHTTTSPMALLWYRKKAEDSLRELLWRISMGTHVKSRRSFRSVKCLRCWTSFQSKATSPNSVFLWALYLGVTLIQEDGWRFPQWGCRYFVLLNTCRTVDVSAVQVRGR